MNVLSAVRQSGALTAAVNAIYPFEAYAGLEAEEIHARILGVKERMGRHMVVLGHHYQRDEVIRHADFTGDSLKLAQLGVAVPEARSIVFCGVHFMAETADILSRPEVSVLLPDLAAGCSMADMADLPSVSACWDELDGLLGPDQVAPITYINSAASLKAFCGMHGGIVCTSSNAPRVLTWAFARREKVLFFPDQHLGRNTALDMGITPDEIILWQPEEELGGNTPEDVERARVILWAGHCSVHQMFLPAHVDMFRAKYPDIRVIVHPECSREVVGKSDYSGSTEFIIRTVSKAAPGTRWVVGTELNLVNRLARMLPDREVHFLSPTYCVCSTMNRIDPPHLLWTLENVEAGAPVNRIAVPGRERHFAQVALTRMLDLG